MNDIHKLRPRLEKILKHALELEEQLADPAVLENMPHYRKLSKAFSDTKDIVKTWSAYQKAENRINEAERLVTEVDDQDQEMHAMIQEEQEAALQEKEGLFNQLQDLLLPKDTEDDCHAILEIRAGTGGDESCLFAADLFRMYCRYVERQHWKLEILSSSEAELGGYKEMICRIEGKQVYGCLKFESGGHRVQRVPDTEAQGRIHTSACTVAVLPEISEQEIEINPADLRIDTFRASGAGGQHVNKTDSAVRITHKPTGLVVECQDDRSQHRNRARAMSVLAARLHEKQREAQQQKTAATRKLLIGSGDRSERIRTYNFPQGRMTDHRIGLTLYKLTSMMEGDLDELLDALHLHHRADLLAESALDMSKS